MRLNSFFGSFIIFVIKYNETKVFSPVFAPNPLHPLPHYLRCIERLKAKNERLTAALERRKGESEQISITLSKLEADCSALQMALRYWYIYKTHLTHTDNACLHTYACSLTGKFFDVSQNSEMCTGQQSNTINCSHPVRSCFLFVAVIDSEECEEAYSELLSLYGSKKQQSIPPQTDSAGV